MKIGLLRHLTVVHPSEKLLSSREFEEWVKQYDNGKVKEGLIDLGETNWELCYTSDLPRAVQTAQNICNCPVVTTDCLREVPVSPLFNTNIRLPVPLWLGLGRMGWFFSHRSQPETMAQTIDRVRGFLYQVCSSKESNILLVTHGFVMGIIQKELYNNGFRGNRFVKARNGIIYVFQK